MTTLAWVRPLPMNPDYRAEKDKCIEFLRTFQNPDDGTMKYATMLQEISDRRRQTLDISLADLEDFCSKEDKLNDFVTQVRSNTRRYVSLFADAADDLIPERSVCTFDEDSFDVLMRQVSPIFFKRLHYNKERR